MDPRVSYQEGSSGPGWSQPPEEGGLSIFLDTSSHEKPELSLFYPALLSPRPRRGLRT